MKKIILIGFFMVCFVQLHAQSITDLISNHDYSAVIKHESDANLTAHECYIIGFAFFQLENDIKAIAMYDKAISKGLDDDLIHLYKGLALRYHKQYDKAIESFKTAVKRNPKGQKNYTELANAYYETDKYDSALFYFYKARELPFELADAYDKIPGIYHLQEKYDMALKEYIISASLIDKGDTMYVELLKNIGLLEYLHTKNYRNAIKAYTEMLAIVPAQYDLYHKLIKVYSADKQYIKADSIYHFLKAKYEAGALTKDLMEMKGVFVDEFVWNGQKINVKRYFEKPAKFADPIYQFFLLDKAGKKIEKKFLTEKTDMGIDGVKHILCGIDKETGWHHTYGITWQSDDIEYPALKENVLKILDKRIQPIASSNTARD